MIQTYETLPPIIDLLNKAGIRSSIKNISPSNPSGNNRIYRVETSKDIFVAKQYFVHESDKRDRLSAELSFLNYARNVAANFVPRLYAFNSETGWALYEHINGTHILPGNIGWQHLEQAIHFFCELNKSSPEKLSSNMPLASEAVFSIEEHLNLVDKRIQYLCKTLSNKEAENHSALKFLEELNNFWMPIKQYTKKASESVDWFSRSLEKENYCISPSDFGFHNALLKNDGNIIFIDFEYAGFDDPAKMVADFFSQPAIPVPKDFYKQFVEIVANSFNDPSHLKWRADLLLPVYQVKWCCIILNVFLPSHMERIKFANLKLDESFFKESQLNKAKQILARLTKETI